MSSCFKRSIHLALIALVICVGPAWAGGGGEKGNKDELNNAQNTQQFIQALINLYNQAHKQPPPQENPPPPPKNGGGEGPQEG